jgi:hypothetical protein
MLDKDQGRALSDAIRQLALGQEAVVAASGEVFTQSPVEVAPVEKKPKKSNKLAEMKAAGRKALAAKARKAPAKKRARR